MDRPVFLIGVPRSGTALLRLMLNSGGEVYLPPESRFIPRLFSREPRTPLTRERTDAIAAALADDHGGFLREWRGPAPTGPWLWDHMADRTPAGLLDALYGAYARQHGATRWGDRTPAHTNHMLLIDEILPEALFVHLVRDARDVALSTEERWGDRSHVGIYYTAVNWSQRTRNVEAATHLLGDARVRTLRYEDLIADPPGELRGLCSFLGLTYSDQMADPQPAGAAAPRSRPRSAGTAPSSASGSAAPWQRAMAARDVRLMQEVTGDALRRYGYPIVDSGPSRRYDRLRLRTLAASYAAVQGGRRILQSTGLKRFF